MLSSQYLWAITVSTDTWLRHFQQYLYDVYCSLITLWEGMDLNQKHKEASSHLHVQARWGEAGVERLLGLILYKLHI